jgi:hypothetical protein
MTELPKYMNPIWKPLKKLNDCKYFLIFFSVYNLILDHQLRHSPSINYFLININKMRITPDLILSCSQTINAIKQRQLNLRGKMS